MHLHSTRHLRLSHPGWPPLWAVAYVLCIVSSSSLAVASTEYPSTVFNRRKASKSSLGVKDTEFAALVANGTKDTSYLCQCKDILWAPGPETGTYQGSPVVEEHYALKKKLKDGERKGEVYDVVFYGDSITKRWLEKTEGLSSLNKVFGKYNPLVMGVGGDQVGNLWWRLMMGEVPTEFEPKVIVVLIGTNDLGAIEACSRNGDDDLAATVGINARIRHVVAYLREQQPSSYIVVLGVLPRSGWTMPSQSAWPNRLTPAIEAINNASRALHTEDSKVHWIDCGPAFYNESGLIPELFSDGLHPTSLGYEVLGACLQPTVDTLWYQASLPSHKATKSGITLPPHSNTTTPSKAEACHDAKHPAEAEGSEISDSSEISEISDGERKPVGGRSPSAEDAMFAGRMAVVKPLKALAPVEGCVYCERDTYEPAN